MKNKIYYPGIFSVVITTCGCIFKIMHWPVAGILLVTGLVSLSLLFLPVAVNNMVKSENNRKLKNFYILAAIIMALNIIGALFKIMHWPGAGKIMMIAIPLPFVVLLPAWIFSNGSASEVNYRNLLAVMFFFAYFAAISSILTIRVSYNVVESFAISANQIKEKAVVLKEAAARDSENPVNQEAELLYQKINNIRQLMLLQVSQDKNSDKNIVYTDVKPQIEAQYLTDLKAEIIKFKLVVQRQYGSDSHLNRYMEEAFAIYTNSSDNGATWEELWLNNNIIASAIESMNFLEFRIRLVEFEIHNVETHNRASV